MDSAVYVLVLNYGDIEGGSCRIARHAEQTRDLGDAGFAVAMNLV